MTSADEPGEQPPVDGHRRKILTAALFGLPAALLADSLLGKAGLVHAATAAPTAAPASFAAVSTTLTGFTAVDGEQAQRAWAGLVRKTDNFPARFDTLARALSANGIRSVEQLPAPAIDNDPALKATAMSIIAAWYLGRVGDVVPRADVGPAFVSYTGALMWRPTVDATVIPTYATGKPGHWASKPTSLATD